MSAPIFLGYWLRETGNVPNAETFQEHLAWKRSYLSPERFTIRREALRWYYREGRRRTAKTSPVGSALPNRRSETSAQKTSRIGDYRVYGMNDVPPSGATDLGGPPWERTLVRRIREKGLAAFARRAWRGQPRKRTGAGADGLLA